VRTPGHGHGKQLGTWASGGPENQNSSGGPKFCRRSKNFTGGTKFCRRTAFGPSDMHFYSWELRPPENQILSESQIHGLRASGFCPTMMGNALRYIPNTIWPRVNPCSIHTAINKNIRHVMLHDTSYVRVILGDSNLRRCVLSLLYFGVSVSLSVCLFAHNSTVGGGTKKFDTSICSS